MVCPSVIAEQAFKHFLQQWFYGLSPSLTLKTEETGAISIVSEVRSDSQPRQLQKTKRRSSQASRLKRRARRAQERLVGSADNTNSCKPSGSGQCGSSFTPMNNSTVCLFVCLLMWWAGNCSISEYLPELIQQVRQDLAGAPGGQP